MLRRRESDMQERPPLRSLRFANQRHLRFLRKTVAFARVTRNARANYVFPSRCPTAIPWHYVIEIQIITIKSAAAVLAGVLVPLENVVAGKLHFLFRQPIKKEQHDHARHPDLPRNRLDEFVIGRVRRKIAPAFEIVRQEIIRVVRGDDMRVSGIDERERTSRRADVHRLPETIQHQNLTI